MSLRDPAVVRRKDCRCQSGGWEGRPDPGCCSVQPAAAGGSGDRQEPDMGLV